MFVYNIKINGSKTFKLFFTGVVILLIIILGIVTFRVFHGASTSSHSSCMPQGDVAKISANNYTNVLKSVHENIDAYVGMKINFTGYVYRVSDLTTNQFVLARDMIISSDYQSVIVGFLCEYTKAQELADDTWVEITGEITKGTYHGDMPVIKITSLTTTTKPTEEFVYPPDESYIPTTAIL